MRRVSTLAVATLALASIGCWPDEGSSGPDGRSRVAESEGMMWLRGDTEERFRLVEKHLRGFDVAMAETGYRYEELYWAGQDHNWGYAAYQLEKIETAVANGVERRPRRAASARVLGDAVERVHAAVDARDPTAFDHAFEALTDTCNACHQEEHVPFVAVAPPSLRTSIVHAPPIEQAGAEE